MVAYKQATTDSLCKILNRHGWELAAAAQLNRLNRQGGLITLVYIDVDDFKSVNDSFGHNNGDQVLVQVASMLRRYCRSSDVIGRRGGDEFVVMSHCFNDRQARQLSLRLAEGLARIQVKTSDASFIVSASVGAIVTDNRAVQLNSLLREADNLMYKNKAARSATVSARPA